MPGAEHLPEDSNGSTQPLLEVRDLVVEYVGAQTSTRAVDHVNLDLYSGEFLGLVGESACGKSTLLFAISRLLTDPAEIVSGSVTFKGRDLVHMREKQLRHLRWRDLLCRDAERDERPESGHDHRSTAGRRDRGT